MKKILITGGAGFVGRRFCKRYLDAGDQVYCVDPVAKDTGGIHPDQSWPLFKPKDYNNFHFFQQDCREWFKQHTDDDFDYVFHLAAEPRVEFSVHNPSYTMKQNVLVTSTLLEWATNHDVKRVIFSSSSSVNGDGDGVPRSPYGLHKLVSEMECKLFSELYGLDTVCLRYFNAYSEDQSFSGAYSTAIGAWMEIFQCHIPHQATLWVWGIEKIA